MRRFLYKHRVQVVVADAKCYKSSSSLGKHPTLDLGILSSSPTLDSGTGCDARFKKNVKRSSYFKTRLHYPHSAPWLLYLSVANSHVALHATPGDHQNCTGPSDSLSTSQRDLGVYCKGAKGLDSVPPPALLHPAGLRPLHTLALPMRSHWQRIPCTEKKSVKTTGFIQCPHRAVKETLVRPERNSSQIKAIR